jgi:hypothetical protein
MADFTPVSAAIGGALIGLAATLLMLLTGRIAGISGIFGACLNITTPDKGWRIAFIIGLILATAHRQLRRLCFGRTADARELGNNSGRRPPCRFWDPAGWRLHVRARRLRSGAPFSTIDCGHGDLHGHGGGGRILSASRIWELSNAYRRRAHLWLHLRLGPPDLRHGSTREGTRLSRLIRPLGSMPNGWPLFLKTRLSHFCSGLFMRRK